MTQDPADWKTSSYTGQQGDCVEVKLGARVGIRDTKNRGGGELEVSAEAWRATLAAARVTRP